MLTNQVMIMNKDEVFKEHYSKPSDFKFTTKVAGVFDDMVNRSVPFYEEIQRMVAELAADHAMKIPISTTSVVQPALR